MRENPMLLVKSKRENIVQQYECIDCHVNAYAQGTMTTAVQWRHQTVLQCVRTICAPILRMKWVRKQMIYSKSKFDQALLVFQCFNMQHNGLLLFMLLTAIWDKRKKREKWSNKIRFGRRRTSNMENQNAREHRILRRNIKFIHIWMVSREYDGIQLRSK